MPTFSDISLSFCHTRSFAVAKGDVILSVNGLSTTGKKGKDVRQMVDDAGSDVNLQIQYKSQESRKCSYSF